MSMHEELPVSGNVPSLTDEIAQGKGLTLAQAAKLFPCRKAGKAVHPNTVGRWAMTGVRRTDGTVVVLETARWSRSVYTSASAVARFIKALAQVDDTPPIVAPATGRAAEKARDEEQRRLRELGL